MIQNDNPQHRKGLHVVAAFEALKGLLVLAGGLELLRFVHRDLEEFGKGLLIHIGLNPDGRLPKVILQHLEGVNEKNILFISGAAVLYAAVRLTEAYGLWKTHSWASWLGIVSGGLYLPFEFYEIYEKFTWMKVGFTFGNILVVIYLYWTRPHKPVKKAEGSVLDPS